MIEIRETRLSDIRAIVDVNTRVWQLAYHQIINDTTLRSLKDNIEDRVSFFEEEFKKNQEGDASLYQAVAVEGDKVVGFIKYGDHRNDESFSFNKTAEVYAIYVDKDHQGQSVGKRLIHYAVTKMLALKSYEQLVIWTLERNSYRSFYESIGGTSEYARIIEIRGQQLDEVGYLFSDLNKLRERTVTIEG